jgi:Spy/CpxP family protein refolding chaperone
MQTKENQIMKKRLGILAIVIATTALVAVPILYAAGPHMRGHGGPGGAGHHGGHGGFGMLGMMLQHVKGELDLSAAQTEQIKTIFRETHEQNAQLHGQMRDGIHDIFTVLISDPNNIAGAQAVLDQQAATERQMKQAMLTATSKALNVLTPAQRTKLAQIVSEHHAKRAER